MDPVAHRLQFMNVHGQGVQKLLGLHGHLVKHAGQDSVQIVLIAVHLVDVQQLVEDDGDPDHEQVLDAGRQKNARSLVRLGVLDGAPDWGQAGQIEMYPIESQAVGDGAESPMLLVRRHDQEGARTQNVARIINLQGQNALDVADAFEGPVDASAMSPAGVTDESAGRRQLGLRLVFLVIEQCHENRPLVRNNR